MDQEAIKLMKNQIQQARGLEPADFVLKNCTVVDVFCGELLSADGTDKPRF